MIRKQLYIGEGHQQKLRRLAGTWGCTEAEVVRAAIERLPDPAGDPIQQLQVTGVLAPPRADEDLPEEDDFDALEGDLEDFLAEQVTPWPLAEAVLEDRR